MTNSCVNRRHILSDRRSPINVGAGITQKLSDVPNERFPSAASFGICFDAVGLPRKSCILKSMYSDQVAVANVPSLGSAAGYLTSYGKVGVQRLDQQLGTAPHRSDRSRDRQVAIASLIQCGFDQCDCVEQDDWLDRHRSALSGADSRDKDCAQAAILPVLEI